MLESKPTIGFRVEVVVESDDVGFHAYCPALKGLHVGGQTEEEALQNAADAAILYIKSLIRHGEPIPVGVAVRNISQPPSRLSHSGSYHTQELKLACSI
jgi:predicted RNase H-like HicB family nuclease